ncbi:hypothetical protein ACLOJK_010102 [Asimina triloba]
MADVSSERDVLPRDAEPVPAKRGGGRSRKALKPKEPTSNEANILAGNPSPSSLVGKENQDGLRLLLSPTKIKPVGTKQKSGKHALAAELQQMQEKLEQMRIEKEKTEELLTERDEMLKRKEEELEARGKEQEKLQLELKKLQKLKEFKPTMVWNFFLPTFPSLPPCFGLIKALGFDFDCSLPLVQSLREQEEEKKGKKKARTEMKRPTTAYALWCKDQWNEIKKEKHEAGFKEISNILSSRWKNLSTEEKRPYEVTYQADKETYLQITGKERRENEAMKLLEAEQKQKTAMELLDQYLRFRQEADKEENMKTRKERDPSKPKKPLSAFFLYSNDRRPSLLAEKKSILEVSKILGEEWKSLPEEKRAPYEEIAKKQKEEYLLQMELYKQKKNEEAAALQKQDEEQRKVEKQEALQLLKKKEKTDNIIKKTKEKKKKQKEQKVDPNKPRKPATSFLLFSLDFTCAVVIKAILMKCGLVRVLMVTRPEIRNPTLQALISVKWKELTEDEKQVWKDKAAAAVAAYKKELEEYNKIAAAIDSSNPHCEE